MLKFIPFSAIWSVVFFTPYPSEHMLSKFTKTSLKISHFKTEKNIQTVGCTTTPSLNIFKNRYDGFLVLRDVIKEMWYLINVGCLRYALPCYTWCWLVNSRVNRTADSLHLWDVASLLYVFLDLYALFCNAWKTTQINVPLIFKLDRLINKSYIFLTYEIIVKMK
jgi:hypothetical protein